MPTNTQSPESADCSSFSSVASSRKSDATDLDVFLTSCKLNSKLRVLDIATGRGAVAFLLAAEGLSDVVGIDACAKNLSEAVRVTRRDGGPRFACADPRRLPFEDGAFDLVVTRRGPQHFEDLGAVLDEVRRVLRPRGRFVAHDRAVIEPESTAIWRELDRRLTQLGAEYAPSQWRRLLEERGFVIEQLEPYEREVPLTLLFDAGSDEGLRSIEARLSQVDGSARSHLLLREVDGQRFLRHDYVRLSAMRNA